MTDTIDQGALPVHIGFIMDGNGRWAKEQGLPRTAGHKKGAEVVRLVIEHAKKRGIQIVTLYAFSTENWKRPKAEVKTLLDLFRKYMNEDIRELQKQGIRVSFIGEREKFPADMVARMNEIERETMGNKDFRVILALNYGFRDDMIYAIKKIASDILDRKYLISSIDEAKVNAALSTHDTPYPDLIIRTSGDQRLSNFLMWESAYAELYFTPIYWPDFNEHDLDDAIEAYGRRSRRFGNIAS
ncbi:MAG: di-trans,poly-cis-decaprenylcistransferase [Alphaproteobacteria bacterium]|nr:di-trans,poly-cis-decaprenylcistransferase [Alphaproteobacteria bacterium]